MRERPVHDVGSLPTWGFDSRGTPWWGTLGFIAIEGTGFGLAIAAYLYLLAVNPKWPLGPPPGPIWPGTALAVVLVASALPNWWTNRAAWRQDLGAVRIWLVIMSAIGLVTIMIRLFEIASLNLRWDSNAYGSVVWLILGLHATHIATDVADTLVLTVLMFTPHAQPRRFSDVTDNVFYWYFVVASWLPLYALIYWAPRLTE